jgi:hypothetical protein
VLYIVLTLVLAAFGLLIAALTTAETLWAWISVVVSVVAAALLVMDWIKGRRKKASGDEKVRPKAVTVGGTRHHRDEPPAVDRLDDPLIEDEDVFRSEPQHPMDFEPPVKMELPSGPDNLPSGPDDVRTLVTEPVEPPVEDVEPSDPGDEPGEEPTDASDLLVVAGLNAEVRVVDEHPRYHLATCVWLANRPTIPIPVSEARQLGFTPCSRCGPDATLAARHRAAR